MSEKKNEYIINQNEILEINHNELDPNGQPLITVLTPEEYDKIKDK
jgi:hypothetical protein